jgi:tetratricopeptide (TPR) repeat protein
MLDNQNSARARAIDQIFRKTMNARPNSREYVAALIEVAEAISSIDGALFERTIREACIVADELQQWDLYTNALGQHAWALFRSGELGLALMRAEHAAHIARQRVDTKCLNIALHTIALIRGRIGDVESAQQIWSGLISSAQANSDDLLEARSRMAYGLLLSEIDKFDLAYAHYVKAHELLDKHGKELRALAANNAADAALNLGDYLKTENWLKIAYLACPKESALWHSHIAHTNAQLALAQNRRDAARDSLARSLEVLPSERDDVSHSANLYLDIGLLHIGDGDAKKALAPLDHALALAQDSGDAALVARVHDALHAAYEKIGDFTTALQHCRDGTTALKRHAEAKSAEHVSVLKAAESLVHERAKWQSVRYDA